MQSKLLFLLISITTLSSCSQKTTPVMTDIQDPLLVANVAEGKSQQFASIQQTFSDKNPGYAIDYIHQSQMIEKNDDNRVVFIQDGGGTMDINGHGSSKFSVGDILALRPGDQIYADSLFSALVISSPDEFPRSIPSFIRPDWDPEITDVPGGCATATNAYRRILLTWKETVGPYVYHSVNAHRVRIMDSFSHYHPKEGGFDEFYLVQMAAPTAQLITSHQVDQIEQNDAVSEASAKTLIKSHSLQVGDLVYLPRGVMHRGLGNALVQVITVPGFIPGAEIGVDHHLLSLNRRLGFGVVPYNKEASSKAIIK